MKHLLVIRLSALGDAAIAQPVVRAYAWANPDVHFTVAAPPLLAPLFAGIDNVDFVGIKKQQSARAISRQMRSIGADAVADLHGIPRVRHAVAMLWFDALLHGRWLPVRHLHKGRLSRWLFLRHIYMLPRKPQDRRYSEVFDRLGLDNRHHLVHSNCQTHHHPAPGTKTSAIGIAPFAQHPGKIWPWENTCRLALMLAAEGYQVRLFGSGEEATLLESLAARHPDIVSLAGKQSFADELEIIRNLALMVSMDSANMHFASAVGTPVVSIWGATHPDFGFYGYAQDRANALCAHLPCQPCSTYGKRPCRYGDYRCLQAVTPEAVMEKIKKALQ